MGRALEKAGFRALPRTVQRFSIVRGSEVPCIRFEIAFDPCDSDPDEDCDVSGKPRMAA